MEIVYQQIEQLDEINEVSELHNLPTLNQKETYNLNRPMYYFARAAITSTIDWVD